MNEKSGSSDPVHSFLVGGRARRAMGLVSADGAFG